MRTVIPFLTWLTVGAALTWLATEALAAFLMRAPT